MKRIARSGIGFVLALGLTGVMASAQNQNSSSGSSLGDYARQIRKDPGAKNTPKVFDNDNLPKEDKLSVIGQAPAPATADSSDKSAQADSAAPAADDKTTAAKSGDNKDAAVAKAPNDVKAASTGDQKAPEDEATKQTAAKQWGDKIAGQKDQIDLLTRELDVLQREYQIRAAAMYADAGNRLRNSGDWDKQDAQYKQQIADKQKALDDAKQKLDDLQEQARKAGASVSQ